MQFVFPDQRTATEKQIVKTSLKRQWSVDDIFPVGAICPSGTESERLKWAPVLISLAFGEATAFYGFGNRIAEAPDLSTKMWLSIHLLDEARHSEGFSRLLNYLYPSYEGKHETLFANKHAYLFYGNTHRCSTLLEWLLCTQMAEVFGKECYRTLHNFFKFEPVVFNFKSHILTDELAHITYIGGIIDSMRAKQTDQYWRQEVRPFIDKMLPLCRNMFEGNQRSPMYRAFQEMGIDVTAFCDRATHSIQKRYVQ